MEFDTKLTQIIESAGREWDGKYHPSSHLAQWEGHTCLDFKYKGEGRKVPYHELTRMMTGTLWHKWIEGFAKLEGAAEVDLTTGMPSGWSGTADFIQAPRTDIDYPFHILWDFKTTSAKSMPYINGVKPEHKWQLSMYYRAAESLGYNLANSFTVLYIPIDGGQWKKVISAPYTENKILNRVAEVEQAVYLFQNTRVLPEHPGLEWSVKYDKYRTRWLVKRAAPWWTKYCAYGDECPCGGLKEQRVGWWYWNDRDQAYELKFDTGMSKVYDILEIPEPNTDGGDKL
jgi:hypothetical protein